MSSACGGPSSSVGQPDADDVAERTLYDALTAWPLTSTAPASMTFWMTLRE